MLALVAIYRYYNECSSLYIPFKKGPRVHPVSRKKKVPEKTENVNAAKRDIDHLTFSCSEGLRCNGPNTIFSIRLNDTETEILPSTFYYTSIIHYF